MKSQKILLFILSLSQTIPLWAMNGPEELDSFKGVHSKPSYQPEEDEEVTADQEIGEEEEPYSVRLIGPVRLSILGNPTGSFELMPKKGGAPLSYEPSDLRIEVLNFEKDMAIVPDFSVLQPFTPIPADFELGRSYKRIRYSFHHGEHGYQAEALDTFTAYPHRAEWEPHQLTIEEQERHQSIYSLLLKVRLEDNSEHIAAKEFKIIAHTLGLTGEQQTGKLFFDGTDVFLRRYRPQQWIVPSIPGRLQLTYDWLFKEAEETVPTHQGGEILFVEPIPIPGERLPDPRRGYRGDYDSPSSTLPPANRRGNLSARFLVYSDGNNIFLPKVTHELWERDGWRVGFSIASYQQNKKLCFLPQAEVTNEGKLPKGLYALRSIQEVRNERTEKWKRLNDIPLEVEIKVPAGIASIPGMGCVYVPPLP